MWQLNDGPVKRIFLISGFPFEIRFVFGVAAMFIEKRCYHVFGYDLNTIFCLWDPLSFVFIPQDNKKQLQTAFYTELQTML